MVEYDPRGVTTAKFWDIQGVVGGSLCLFGLVAKQQGQQGSDEQERSCIVGGTSGECWKIGYGGGNRFHDWSLGRCDFGRFV